MEHMRVSKDTRVAELAQAIASKLTRSRQVEITAAGRDAISTTVKGIAALDALLPSLPNATMKFDYPHPNFTLIRFTLKL